MRRNKRAAQAQSTPISVYDERASDHRNAVGGHDPSTSAFPTVELLVLRCFD